VIDLLVIPLAVALDLVFGEMPSNIHPVVGMGRLLSLGARFAPGKSNVAQFLYGAFTVLLVATVFALASYILLKYVRSVNQVLYVLVAAILLKSCFSIRELARAADRVKDSLLRNNLVAARSELHSLVSRETAELSAPNVVAAAVESVAENTSDSFVAPVFFFLILGIPGAMFYRACNTADAMIGYHGKFEYLGKFAARLDDVLNFIPARITGLLIVAAAHRVRAADGRSAWRIMRRDHSLTESPNAGWPMSAMAGSLDTRLEKVGHYRLGDANRSLSPDCIDTAVKLMLITVLLWTGTVLMVRGVEFVVAFQA